MHHLAQLRSLTLATLFAAVSGAGSSGALGAQDAAAPAPAPSSPVPTPPDASDPPAVAGRIAYLEGAVSFRPAAGDTWALAELNRAISTGDRLWADTVGRAEVEVGANAFRFWNQTEVDVVHLDDHALQLRIPQGTTTLRVKSLGPGGIYELDAPNAAVAIGQAGEYRVDVSPDGLTTNVTVWSGDVHVTASGSTFDVNAHQVATIHGDSAATYNVADVGSPDAFDQWCTTRDQREDRATVSTRYVSADMGGVEDLDEAGTWATEADYGPVWYPTGIVVGWAPYHFGHWAWEGPWGWVWVEDEPWGWAPFHYGRWAFIGSRWGWCPGPGIYRPVFAPGLVAFVGGAGWGVSVGFGAGVAVGWFPLAPHEPYFPPYAAGIGYRQRVNVFVNVTNVNVTNFNYRNRGVPGAVVAMPQDAFARGDPVARAGRPVPLAAAASARVIGTGPGVIPTSAGLAPLRSVNGRPAAVPPARLAARTVVANHAPPPAPVPFAAQRQAIVANGGRPLTVQQRSTVRSTNAAVVRPTTFPVRSAAAPLAGHTLAPARPGLPAPLPALAQPRAVGIPTVHPSTSPTLDDEFHTQSSQMESRHVQEFAKPPAGESPEALAARQEGEHRSLQQQYEGAKARGAQHMPAAPRGGGGGGKPHR